MSWWPLSKQPVLLCHLSHAALMQSLVQKEPRSSIEGIDELNVDISVYYFIYFVELHF